MTTFGLVWYSDAFCTTALETLDFYDNDAGLQFAYNGIVPAVGAREQNIIQTFTLRANGDAFDDLADILQTIDLWQRRVLESKNPALPEQVWVQRQLGDETNLYQAQVLSLDYTIADDPLLYGGIAHLNNLVVSITHTPWEEPPPYVATTAITDIDGLGGMAQITESIDGDLPARLVETVIYPQADLNEMWLGWRTARLGDVAVFAPIWPLYIVNSGSRDADTDTDTDAAAYDGTRLTTTFATEANFIQRAAIKVGDVNTWLGGSLSILNDIGGRFGILLRACMSDANSEAHVRIGYGYINNTYTLNHPVWRSPVRVTGTSYRLFDVQSVTCPPEPLGSYWDNFSIAIQARRAAGSGSLYLDCLGLVPLDEGSLHILSTDDLTTQRRCRIYRLPAGRVTAIVNDGAYGYPDRTTYDIARGDGNNWKLPNNGTPPLLVAFAQNTAGSPLDATFHMTYTYARRFRVMRGNL